MEEWVLGKDTTGDVGRLFQSSFSLPNCLPVFLAFVLQKWGKILLYLNRYAMGIFCYFFTFYSQIGSTVVKAFAFQADGLGFNSPSGYKVGRPGHSKYVWVGQYEPSCLKFPSSVLEDKLK